MLVFINGVIAECPDNIDASRCLTFKQLRGMITDGQWVELVREVIRSDDSALSALLITREVRSKWTERIKEAIPNVSIKEQIDVLLSEQPEEISYLLTNTDFVDNYWEEIAEDLYSLENTTLKGSIVYMMTFADGEESIKCRNYY